MSAKPFWTDEEMGVAADDSLSNSEAAEILGRSSEAVKLKRRQIARGWVPVNLPWTDSDDEFIRSTKNLNAQQVATRLSRTPHAVAKRRVFLGVVCQSDTNDPNHVGRRRLLAKTCPACGLLLSADWFGFNLRKWRPKCVRCTPDYNKRPERPERKQSEREGKLQAVSLEHAVNSGEPYTEADHSVLADPDLSVFEKCAKLGRTYKAVIRQVSVNGYTSRVGKGDPVKGQWRISYDQASA